MSHMSENLNGNKKEAVSFFRPNPVLRRMSQIADRAVGNESATYAGIAVKTSFFLAVTLAGMIVYLLLNTSVFARDTVLTTVHYGKTFQFDLGKTEAITLAAVMITGLISQLVGIFARKTIPVTGSIYSFSQGFVISFLVFKVLQGYEYLGLEALLLTAAVIGVMSWLYVSGKLRPTEKFNTILMTLVIGSILLALFSFICSLIPVTRPFIHGDAGELRPLRRAGPDRHRDRLPVPDFRLRGDRPLRQGRLPEEHRMVRGLRPGLHGDLAVYEDPGSADADRFRKKQQVTHEAILTGCRLTRRLFFCSWADAG